MKRILVPTFECGSVLLGEKEQPYGPDYTIDEMREITTDIFSFESIRKNDILYVDKTMYIHSLVKSMARSFYFLSRPRRYGKSLFCSTLHALFDGRKELFKGLYIAEKTDYPFTPFPVLHFDFSGMDTDTRRNFIACFRKSIAKEAMRNGIDIPESTPSSMLLDLIDALYEKRGKVVIIIDEFDAPVTDALGEENGMPGYIRKAFSTFYANIKKSSGKIRFLFITGVTKLSNMSIFSKMNNLLDISMDEAFADAFGYTEPELIEYFGEGMDEHMEANQGKYSSRDEFVSRIREYYDGYRFSRDSEVTVYNPVSIGRFFNSGCRFDNYWEQTGGSSLAVTLASRFDLSSIIGSELAITTYAFNSFDISLLQGKDIERSRMLALLYYTGYLTICDAEDKVISLAFPNKEVASSFTGNLLARHIGKDSDSVFLWISRFVKAARNGDEDEMRRKLEEYFSAFSYELMGDERERFYHAIFHAVFLMAGLHAASEDRGMRGRADEVLIAGSHIWIFELKVDRTADEALGQIEEKGYGDKYSYLMKPGMALHKVGISFSSSERKIAEWKCR